MLNTLITQKTVVILSDPTDWDKWLEVIKTKAISGKIWDFVDSSVEKDQLPALVKLNISNPTAVNP